MSLTAQQVNNFKTGIEAALVSGKMNEWQTNFLTDIRRKINRFGTKTHLSERQFSKLQQITEGYQSAPNVVSLGQARQFAHSPTSNAPRIAPKKQNGRQNSWRPITRWNSRYRVSSAKFYLAIAVVLFIAVGQFFGGAETRNSNLGISQPPRQLTSSQFSVTDGDTIKIGGEAKGTRLVGFNTPETFEPVCARGLELGRQATRRLKQLVENASAVTIEKVQCACAPGTHGTSRCNYGRSCGILRVDGQDVGPILISEGLAVPFNCGQTSCPRTPRPWCN